MMCPCCGAENPDDRKICRVCEYEFTEEDIATAVLPPKEVRKRAVVSYIYIIATIIGLAVVFGIFGMWIKSEFL